MITTFWQPTYVHVELSTIEELCMHTRWNLSWIHVFFKYVDYGRYIYLSILVKGRHPACTLLDAQYLNIIFVSCSLKWGPIFFKILNGGTGGHRPRLGGGGGHVLPHAPLIVMPLCSIKPACNVRRAFDLNQSEQQRLLCIMLTHALWKRPVFPQNVNLPISICLYSTKNIYIFVTFWKWNLLGPYRLWPRPKPVINLQ